MLIGNLIYIIYLTLITYLYQPHSDSKQVQIYHFNTCIWKLYLSLSPCPSYPSISRDGPHKIDWTPLTVSYPLHQILVPRADQDGIALLVLCPPQLQDTEGGVPQLELSGLDQGTCWLGYLLQHITCITGRNTKLKEST